MTREACNRDSLVRILSQHQRLLAAAFYEQIADRLVVDFKVRERNLAHLLLLQLVDLLEQLLHRHEDYTRLLRGSPTARQW
jgi:hypothetical protein